MGFGPWDVLGPCVRSSGQWRTFISVRSLSQGTIGITDDLKEAALHYHTMPQPGKLAVIPTKPMATQRDLALAYSPGVAYACTEIAENPAAAATLTSRQNLVAVITNGTAVLGLGNIGPLASKPVMEGKAALFKKFANIDVFDLEVDELDVDKFCDIVAALETSNQDGDILWFDICTVNQHQVGDPRF